MINLAERLERLADAVRTLDRTAHPEPARQIATLPRLRPTSMPTSGARRVVCVRIPTDAYPMLVEIAEREQETIEQAIEIVITLAVETCEQGTAPEPWPTEFVAKPVFVPLPESLVARLVAIAPAYGLNPSAGGVAGTMAGGLIARYLVAPIEPAPWLAGAAQ